MVAFSCYNPTKSNSPTQLLTLSDLPLSKNQTPSQEPSEPKNPTQLTNSLLMTSQIKNPLLFLHPSPPPPSYSLTSPYYFPSQLLSTYFPSPLPPSPPPPSYIKSTSLIIQLSHLSSSLPISKSKNSPLSISLYYLSHFPFFLPTTYLPSHNVPPSPFLLLPPCLPPSNIALPPIPFHLTSFPPLHLSPCSRKPLLTTNSLPCNLIHSFNLCFIFSDASTKLS